MRRRFSSRASRGPDVLPCRWIVASRLGGITARAPRRSTASYTARRSYIPSAPTPPTALSTCSSNEGTASASVNPRLAHDCRLDLMRLRIDGQMELQPGATLGVAVLTDLPLAFAVDLQPGAVEDQVERPGGPLGQRDADGRGPAAERAVIGDGQIEVHQVEERAGEPLGGS